MPSDSLNVFVIYVFFNEFQRRHSRREREKIKRNAECEPKQGYVLSVCVCVWKCAALRYSCGNRKACEENKNIDTQENTCVR